MKAVIRKKAIGVTVLSCAILLLGGCKLKEMRNDSIAEKLLESDNPEVTERACSFIGDETYISFDSFKELSEKETLAIADYENRMINDVPGNEEDANGSMSLIFYKGKSDEVLDKFIYKDGERQPESEKDVFLPPYKRDEPEE